jgi:hypothetical protein
MSRYVDAKIADENKFCNYCGTALSAEADPNKDPEVVEVKAEDKPEPEPAQPQNDAKSRLPRIQKRRKSTPRDAGS